MSATIAQLRAELDEARALLARVFIAEWKEDSCPYGCTGNKCPWCGAQQHVSGHEHGCLIPEARAFLDLRRDEAQREECHHAVSVTRPCAECDEARELLAERESYEYGSAIGWLERVDAFLRRDEARGALGCSKCAQAHYAGKLYCYEHARAAPTESGPLMEGQKFYPDGKLVTEFVRAPEPPRCACPVSQWRGPDEHTDPECPARTGRVKK